MVRDCRTGRYVKRAAEDRFWVKVIKIDGGCWEWTGALLENGYGLFRKDSHSNIRAHRFSWELKNGPIEGGLHVLHKCDNRKCVNPAHLFLGTHQDNMDDKAAKGRSNHAKGVAHGGAILTEEVVLGIRRMCKILPQIRVAEMYGVSKQAVNSIHLRKIWKHI